MRQGHHNKNRSRNRGGGGGGGGGGGRRQQNPVNRVFESNGPDVKIRGNASHIAEKYNSLARDALVSGNTVSAENFFQHAEHYLRILAAAQAYNQQQQAAHVVANERPESPEVKVSSGSDERTTEQSGRSQREPSAGNADPAVSAQPVVPVGDNETAVSAPADTPVSGEADASEAPAEVVAKPARKPRKANGTARKRKSADQADKSDAPKAEGEAAKEAPAFTEEAPAAADDAPEEAAANV